LHFSARGTVEGSTHAGYAGRLRGRFAVVDWVTVFVPQPGGRHRVPVHRAALLLTLAHPERSFCCGVGDQARPLDFRTDADGSARGYQGILVPLAALTSSGYGPNGRSAEPYIYTLPRLR
jgi:hypothetical protein